MMIPLTHVVELDDRSNFGWRFAGLVFAGLLLIAYWQEWVRSPFEWDLAIALTFIFGYKTFTKAFRDLSERRVSADQAVILAALAALYVGEYLAAAEVVYIMLVGETIEEYTAKRFQSDLRQLLTCVPQEAHVLRAGSEEVATIEDILPGEQVVIYPGERIPVDGRILEGRSLIDESTITGESVPREKSTGENVHAGTLNESTRLLVEVSEVGESTVLHRIVELVEHAKEHKAPVQRTADRYAQWFLPLVVGIAFICYLLTGDVMRSVAVLIVACPCAMVLATPAAVLATVSYLARRGVVVKGGTQLERLAEVDCLALDKTGTITRGRPEIVKILSFEGIAETEVLRWAASLEAHSEHILAVAIRNFARSRNAPAFELKTVERHAGLGMEGLSSDGETHLRMGSARFLLEQGLTIPTGVLDALDDLASQGSIAILIARNASVVGALVFRDPPRPEVKDTLHQLHQQGIEKAFLLTGDVEKTAQHVAAAVGIKEVYANLLPEEKVERLEATRRQGRTVAMIGDGVNDSPSLAAADVGIAMGDTGTDIAADAAGVVLMGEEGFARLPLLIRASRRAVETIRGNIFWFGIVANLVAVVAAFSGVLTAIGAAVVHQLTSFLVLMSSLRLLKDWSFTGPFKLSWAQFSGLARPGIRSILGNSRLTSYFAAILALLYLFSGLTLIGPDEVAVVTRFGRSTGGALVSGLHYRLPWPFENIHRLAVHRVNTLEFGFRTVENGQLRQEPPAYEWNIQHREGRYQRVPEESQMLTGDEYLLEMNASIQYSIADPERYLFRNIDVEGVLRTGAEGSLREAVARHSLDQVMVSSRALVEQWALQQIRKDVQPLELGLTIHSVHLQDVHPALEAVDAFREVASSMEEKNRMINEAQGYANQRLPLAGGEAQRRVIAADAYRLQRKNSAAGESERFINHYNAYRPWRRTTTLRLYLETVDAVLPGKTKYILDEMTGRRKLMLFEDSDFPLAELQESLNQIRSKGPLAQEKSGP